MPPDAAEVRAWLTKVVADVRTARAALDLDPPETATAGFHVQQAVEKLLKAFIVARGAPVQRIHDLDELIDDCARLDPAFDGLRSKVAPLTGFAVRFRYPGPTDPPPERVREGLRIAAEVWDLVAARAPVDAVPRKPFVADAGT